MADSEGNEAKDSFMLKKLWARVGPCMHVIQGWKLSKQYLKKQKTSLDFIKRDAQTFLSEPSSEKLVP